MTATYSTHPTPYRTGRTALVIASLIALSTIVGCARNPATGRSQLNLLSRQQEIALGEDAKGQLTQEYGGPVQDAALQAYVLRVGQSMVPYTEADYASLPWEFTLLDSDIINAFALPGGKVFITRGLASKFESEAELAGVLGHEIGHVTARHANNRISNQLLLTGVVVGASIAAGQSEDDWVRVGAPLLVGAVGTGFVLKFNRDEETEADRLGMRYMSRASYDPAAQLRMMQVLQRASTGPRPPELLSTHPHPETRIERIRASLQKDYAQTQGNPAYSLHEDRYRREFLEPLARYVASRPQSRANEPDPAGKAAIAAHGAMMSRWSRYAPSEHWCLTCGGDVAGH